MSIALEVLTSISLLTFHSACFLKDWRCITTIFGYLNVQFACVRPLFYGLDGNQAVRTSLWESGVHFLGLHQFSPFHCDID